MWKKIWIAIATVMILATIVSYINHRYFFNPVAFSKDDITPHEWQDYKRPLTLTYYNLKGERTSRIIDQEDEIRQLLEAMKASPPVEESIEADTNVSGALKLSGKQGTLLEVYLYKDSWRVLNKDYSFFEVTGPLRNLLDNL
ncbi:hypothetical protein QRD89_04295 [Halobacillus sp. ACCC02827]|uniref:hypothetical protein n=1 Tax=Bacillaceae TaxID=186817 RepID=UPI0002A4DE89|nr:MULTISPECIES: hypothetical protein [Bacillaceae]ELK48885.1 hypothetical protein D479_01280 [Halobacillus sp. BAB-2008]QHT45785.1 bestrophin [Bacillus sp. SB49]WJE16587.1 hypothetical protein QRD89_04295 [Halobacillus sp. ACCC02827]